MDNNWHQTGQSPRYTEVGPHGQILHQAATVPPDLMVNYINPQQSTSYHSVSSPGQWTSYPHQPANNKQWWQGTGSYNPYRTTYQDYGHPNNPPHPTYSVVYGPNSYATVSHSGSNTVSYNAPRPS